MSKHFGFLLSLLGAVLMFLLVLSVFGYQLVYDIQKTVIFSVEKKQYETVKKPDTPPTKNTHQLPLHIKQENTVVQQNTSASTVYAVFFGDTHFTRAFPYYIQKEKITKQKYFECFTQKPFANYDIVSVNLETSVASKDECVNSGKSISFRTEPQYLKDLRDMGVTHFNLANNHSYDCGTSGYIATKKHLDEYNGKYFGEGRKDESVILQEEIHGIQIAHISAQDVEQKIDINALSQKVKTLSEQGKFVIVQLHFGIEYKTTHSKRQEEIAHTLVDNGAKLIIGHHPHVIQDMEVYRDVPIFYSLGNFIFDQPFDETLEGLGVALSFNQEKIIDYKTFTFHRDNKLYFINNCSAFTDIKNYIN